MDRRVRRLVGVGALAALSACGSKPTTGVADILIHADPWLIDAIGTPSEIVVDLVDEKGGPGKGEVKLTAAAGTFSEGSPEEILRVGNGSASTFFTCTQSEAAGCVGKVRIEGKWTEKDVSRVIYLTVDRSLVPPVDGGSGGQDGGGGDDGGPGPLTPRRGVCGDITEGNWCWENPLPQGHSLLDATGSAVGDVWVAGDESTRLHWNGKEWKNFPELGIGSFNSIHSVSKDSVCALSGLYGHCLVGGQWYTGNSDPIPGMYGIWGNSPSNYWCVGYDGGTAHFDGLKWSLGGTDQQSTLNAITGTDAGDMWAVGANGAIVHRTTGAWTTVPSPTGFELRALHVPSPNSGFAVGAFGTAVHFDGASWTSMDTGGVTATLNGVWSANNTDAWAVGNAGTVLHWDGSGWAQAPPLTTLDLQSVWGSSSTAVWAFGLKGVMLRWNGAAWSEFSYGIRDTTILDLWSAPGGQMWAVGDDGKVLKRTSAGWTEEDNGGAVGPLFAISGSSAADIWAVGALGEAIHYNGTQWTETSTGVLVDLHGVWSGGVNNVWAVGSSGTAIHFDGSTWSPSTTGTTNDLYTVFGVGGTVYAAGNGGAVFSNTGTGWNTFATGTADDWRTIWGRSPVELFIGGVSGEGAGFSGSGMMKFTGTWNEWPMVRTLPNTPPITNFLFNEIMGSPSTLHAATAEVVFYYNGTAWAPTFWKSAPGALTLWANDKKEAWIGNPKGRILWRQDQ